MSGILFVHDESALNKVLQDVDSIAVAGEDKRWRDFWTERRLDLVNEGAPEELTPAGPAPRFPRVEADAAGGGPAGCAAESEAAREGLARPLSRPV